MKHSAVSTSTGELRPVSAHLIPRLFIHLKKARNSLLTIYCSNCKPSMPELFATAVLRVTLLLLAMECVSAKR